MSQRDKEFARWRTTKNAVEFETVEAMVRHLFAHRISVRSGGSHNLLVSLPELVQMPDFQFGHLSISKTHGQGVKPRYLRLICKAYDELQKIEEEAQREAEAKDDV